ncbi:hypothetical protein ACFFRR_008050 [Megaselia abdita]
MDCGTSLIKYLLFFFNILCSICGILLIAFGVIFINNLGHMKNFDDLQTQHIPVVLIVLGAVILIISFFGCCGAIRESYCMSMTYAFFLLVLLICQLVLIAYVWTNKQEIGRKLEKAVDVAWEERTRAGTQANAMDAIQIGLKCCARRNFIEYGVSIPSSCCQEQNCSNPLNIYVTGCKTALVSLWDNNGDIIKFAGLGIAAIELIGFIFACCLANNIRNYKRRADY